MYPKTHYIPLPMYPGVYFVLIRYTDAQENPITTPNNTYKSYCYWNGADSMTFFGSNKIWDRTDVERSVVKWESVPFPESEKIRHSSLGWPDSPDTWGIPSDMTEEYKEVVHKFNNGEEI